MLELWYFMLMWACDLSTFHIWVHIPIMTRRGVKMAGWKKDDSLREWGSLAAGRGRLEIQLCSTLAS